MNLRRHRTARTADEAGAPAADGTRENLLDPTLPTEPEFKRVPLIVRVYGALCLLDGVLAFPTVAVFLGRVVLGLIRDPSRITVGTEPLITAVLTGAGIAFGLVNAGCLVFFGASIIRSDRRNAVRWSHALIAFTIVEVVVDAMVDGIGLNLLRPLVQLGILTALSVTVDPVLREERRLRRRLRDLAERERLREGTLGRDETGKGYIELNFFNLFWVFVVCSVIGLGIEEIWHFAVVEPGVYQDRAGLLFGPFCPIYGVGAALLTVCLNRLYRKNPLVIFLASAAIGTVFEFGVAMFMKMGFGAVSWDYSHLTIFGMPDPLAQVSGGHVSTMFAVFWGLLGLIWIRWCLPRLLKLINLIPWTWRYSLTTVCAALMLVNAVMTLQSLDCWFERVSGHEPATATQRFYADHFGNDYMQHRFQSMTITPDSSGRASDAEA